MIFYIIPYQLLFEINNIPTRNIHCIPKPYVFEDHKKDMTIYLSAKYFVGIAYRKLYSKTII